MNTKYIFLDIDGTLVGYDSKIPESALKALKKAQANGHKVFIASGRSLPIIYPDLLKEVDFDGIVASGGACVFYNGDAIFRSTISGDDLDKVIRYFKREGIQFLVQTSTALYCEHDFLNTVIPGLIDAGCSKELVEKTFVNIVTIDDIRNAPDIEKFSFYLSPHNPKKISEDLDDDFYVVDFSLGKINAPLFFGEMNMAGVNKATAIEKFMAHVGAPMSDSIAFGDSGNDFEMMQAVGFAVAMGNATEPIKALADYVTTDVDKDGIYNAFVHLGLI